MLPQRGLMTSALDVRAVCVVLRSIVQAKMKPGNAATRCADPNWNIIESLLDSYSCLSPKRLDLLLGSGPKERTQIVALRAISHRIGNHEDCVGTEIRKGRDQLLFCVTEVFGESRWISRPSHGIRWPRERTSLLATPSRDPVRVEGSSGTLSLEQRPPWPARIHHRRGGSRRTDDDRPQKRKTPACDDRLFHRWRRLRDACDEWLGPGGASVVAQPPRRRTGHTYAPTRESRRHRSSSRRRRGARSPLAALARTRQPHRPSVVSTPRRHRGRHLVAGGNHIYKLNRARSARHMRSPSSGSHDRSMCIDLEHQASNRKPNASQRFAGRATTPLTGTRSTPTTYREHGKAIYSPSSPP